MFNLIELFRISTKSYSEKALRDVIYWYSSEVSILLSIEDDNFIVKVEERHTEKLEDFLKTLNDFQLREVIYQRTHEVKDLIAAKAFYPDLVEFKPIGDFDDPIMMDANEAE